MQNSGFIFSNSFIFFPTHFSSFFENRKSQFLQFLVFFLGICCANLEFAVYLNSTDRKIIEPNQEIRNLCIHDQKLHTSVPIKQNNGRNDNANLLQRAARGATYGRSVQDCQPRNYDDAAGFYDAATARIYTPPFVGSVRCV